MKKDRDTMFARLTLVAMVALAVAATTLIDHASASAQDDEPIDALTLLDDANHDATKRRYAQAIPKYKKVLQAVPDQYPSVYYNLAEIKRYKNDCKEAVLLYERYLALQPKLKAQDKAQVNKAIAGCLKTIGARTEVTFQVAGDAYPLLILDGIPVAQDKTTKLSLKPGKYNLKVTATDFLPLEKTVEVTGEPSTVNIELKEKQFEGELTLTVNVEGAEVVLDGDAIGKAPVKPRKVVSGKRFLEVKKDGYHRWIRNIIVPRDDVLEIDIVLQPIKKKK